jgi:hypothetical protein
MSYHGNRISDVINILIIIKELLSKSPEQFKSENLRIEAIRELAQKELLSDRFKDERSAIETLRDACTRRNGISGVRKFDGFIDQWLRNRSITLKSILLQHSKDTLQRTLVGNFFL